MVSIICQYLFNNFLKLIVIIGEISYPDVTNTSINKGNGIHQVQN